MNTLQKTVSSIDLRSFSNSCSRIPTFIMRRLPGAVAAVVICWMASAAWAVSIPLRTTISGPVASFENAVTRSHFVVPGDITLIVDYLVDPEDFTPDGMIGSFPNFQNPSTAQMRGTFGTAASNNVQFTTLHDGTTPTNIGRVRIENPDLLSMIVRFDTTRPPYQSLPIATISIKRVGPAPITRDDTLLENLFADFPITQVEINFVDAGALILVMDETAQVITTPVPLPGGGALLGVGLFVLATLRARQRRLDGATLSLPR